MDDLVISYPDQCCSNYCVEAISLHNIDYESAEAVADSVRKLVVEAELRGSGLTKRTDELIGDRMLIEVMLSSQRARGFRDAQEKIENAVREWPDGEDGHWDPRGFYLGMAKHKILNALDDDA